MTGQVLCQVPVDRAPGVRQHVGELPQRVRELVRPAGTASTAGAAAEQRAERILAAGALSTGALAARLRIVVAWPARRAEAERRSVSHRAPPQLSLGRAG